MSENAKGGTIYIRAVLPDGRWAECPIHSDPIQVRALYDAFLSVKEREDAGEAFRSSVSMTISPDSVRPIESGLERHLKCKGYIA